MPVSDWDCLNADDFAQARKHRVGDTAVVAAQGHDHIGSDMLVDNEAYFGGEEEE